MARPINDLILLGIFNVENKGEKCTFERLVKECFSLFPNVFAFSKYPKWPDSRKLDSASRKLRARKLIVGKPKQGFKLTSLGKKQTQEIAKALRQKKLL